MSASWRSRAPLTGIVAVVLFVIAGAVGGETPDIDASSEEVLSFYTDNEGEQTTSALLGAYGALFLVFFLGALRAALRRGEGERSGLSAVAFGGGLLMTLGILLFAGFTFTLADAAGADAADAGPGLEPAAAQAISALNSDLFFPLAVGTAALLLATGISALGSGALPRWLAWAAVVIGVAAMTPLGFFAFLVALLWIAVTAVVLTTSPAAAATTPHRE